MAFVQSDFVVVGAGIAGLATAYELSRHGSVNILEMESQHGYHTTGRSAAVFIDMYGNEVVQKLTAISRPFFNNPPEGFADAPLLERIGGLIVAGEEHRDGLKAVHDYLAPSYPALREMPVEEAIAMAPFLSAGYLSAAMYDPAVGAIEVSGLEQGFIRGMASRGAVMHTQRKVTGIARSGSAWRIETGKETFISPKVVNAAGAWADAIAGMAGVAPVGLVPKRRTVVVFEAPAGISVGHWPIVGEVADEFYFKPESGKILASPADETPVEPCDAQPEELDIATVMDRMERISGRQIRHITHKWAGLRSFVADESPVLGEDPSAEGFYWCAALGGFGMQTAPIAGRIAAESAAGNGIPDDVRDAGITETEIGPRRG